MKLKKYPVIIIILTFIVYGVKAPCQEVFCFHKCFSEDEFEFVESPNGYHIMSSKYQITNDTAFKTPELPYVTFNILVSPNCEYYGSTIETTELLVRDRIEIAQNMPPTTVNFSGKNVYNSPAKYTKFSYPESNIIFTGSNIMCGYRFFTFLFCPFRYEADTRSLYLKSEVFLNISMSSMSNRGNDYILPISNAKTEDRDFAKSFFTNSSELDVIYPCNQLQERMQTSPGNSNHYEYIIITRDSLKTAYQPLANWKSIKGVRAKVLPIEMIDTLYTGATLQLKIKKALKDYYDQGMSYALLGGDADVVPVQYCSLPNLIGQGRVAPADLYYACFGKNFEWDKNNNGIYGEYADSISVIADIIVTRIPLKTSKEISSFVDQLIKYENAPDTIQWNDKILMGGGRIEEDCLNGKSDAERLGDILYNSFIKPYWNHERYCIYDRCVDNYTDDPSALVFANLETELSKGYTFADVSSHGSVNEWAARSQYLYDNNKALSQNNCGKTIVTTVACLTNAFDNDSLCLSESFFKNSNSGVLAYLGNSRESWYSYSPYYIRQFYKRLLHGTTRQFGRACKEMKTVLSSSYSTNPYTKWQLFALNAMGDPEMPIFLSKPKYFGSPNLIFNNGTLTVDAGVDSCRICVSSDNGNSYYKVSCEERCATFNNVSIGYCIAITKPGYVPFIQRIGEHQTYIQDETLSGANNISASYIHIGSNVTSARPVGPVNVHGGRTTLNAIQGVEIKNDFEVNSGASFEIHINHVINE